MEVRLNEAFHNMPGIHCLTAPLPFPGTVVKGLLYSNMDNAGGVN